MQAARPFGFDDMKPAHDMTGINVYVDPNKQETLIRYTHLNKGDVSMFSMRIESIFARARSRVVNVVNIDGRYYVGNKEKDKIDPTSRLGTLDIFIRGIVSAATKYKSPIPRFRFSGLQLRDSSLLFTHILTYHKSIVAIEIVGHLDDYSFVSVVAPLVGNSHIQSVKLSGCFTKIRPCEIDMSFMDKKPGCPYQNLLPIIRTIMAIPSLRALNADSFLDHVFGLPASEPWRELFKGNYRIVDYGSSSKQCRSIIARNNAVQQMWPKCVYAFMLCWHKRQTNSYLGCLNKDIMLMIAKMIYDQYRRDEWLASLARNPLIVKAVSNTK